MEPITFEGFITKLRKTLRDSHQNIADNLIAGGVDNMEKYKYLLGQAHAYQYLDQEISNLLNPKEQKKDEQTNDNVVRFDGQSKD
jgi:uncharacterized protein YaaN involved in tellurite resistance